MSRVIRKIKEDELMEDSDGIKNKLTLTFSDFQNLNGYFFDRENVATLEVDDFEYTESGLLKNQGESAAFIAFSKERADEARRVNKPWLDGNIVAERNLEKISLLITETPIIGLQKKLPQFIVENTWEFMHELGEYLRNKTSIPVVAITGSVGKTTTRMMIEHLLKEDLSVLSNRGNHNTRFAIPLYMDKLAQSPDILNLEVSLNALNNRGKGPQSTFIKPTIALVTSVDYAHMSTMSSLNNLAEYKANIFNGLVPKGTAIINKDIGKEQYDIIYHSALKRTTRIFTYSMSNKNADVYLVSKKELKYLTEVTIYYKESYYSYYLGIGSPGMIENSLGAISILIALGKDITKYLPRFLDFRSLPKIMELKTGSYAGRQLDIIDDTHNAAIPSMINALTSFKEKAPYYRGAKLLVLGQVADLGKFSKEEHRSLISYINDSGADYLLGYGEDMKEVVANVTIYSQWFEALPVYLNEILTQITNDSFVLLKGSITGSDYYKISTLLTKKLDHVNRVMFKMELD